MRFPLIARVELRSHLYHARVELRCGSSHYDFPCNKLRIPPITLLLSFILPLCTSDRSPFVKSTCYPFSVFLTIVLLPSSRPCPANRFVRSRLAPFPSRGILPHPPIPRGRSVSLSPNRSRASFLPPPARADHVLLSRSPPSGMRPSAATVRNSCCACVRN